MQYEISHSAQGSVCWEYTGRCTSLHPLLFTLAGVLISHKVLCQVKDNCGSKSMQTKPVLMSYPHAYNRFRVPRTCSDVLWQAIRICSLALAAWLCCGEPFGFDAQAIIIVYQGQERFHVRPGSEEQHKHSCL